MNKNQNARLLYTGGLIDESACYELAQTEATIAVFERGTFIPAIENTSDTWQGRTGLVHSAAMTDISNLAGYDI